MKHSISEAARIVGVTRKTFYKHIDKKSISVEKDDNDMPVIDASELVRVYGDQCDFEYDKKDKDTGQDTNKGKQESTAVSSEKDDDAVLKKEIELIRAQLSSERESFEEQIDYLRKKLDDSDSETRKLTAMITDQRSQTDKSERWQKSLKALESRIANQEKVAREHKEERHKILRQNQALKKALSQEKNKSFFQKLFG